MYLKLQDFVLKFDIVNFFPILFFQWITIKYKTIESLRLVRFSKVLSCNSNFSQQNNIL